MALLRRFVSVILAAVMLGAFALAVLSSFFYDRGRMRKKYLCVWEDGSITWESYASFCTCYVASSDFLHWIYRGGMYGSIEYSRQYAFVSSTLSTGGLAELLSLETKGLMRIERLSFYRETKGTIWYSGGYYVWEKYGLQETSSAYGETLVLLSGSVSASRLMKSGVKYLELRGEAELSAGTLVGTEVESVVSYAPYLSDGGAVYLQTTALRLVAACPNLTSLVAVDYDYADEGALLACTSMEELVLPFAGSAPSPAGNYYHGELAYLFSDGLDYRVPDTLKRVKITGGTLTAHAFYRCGMVEEIDLCGISEERIHRDALADCTGLQTVHSPTADLNLNGNFTSYAAPCGCTVFERTG